MHRHDEQSQAESNFRPKASRPDPDIASVQLRAAMSGRAGVTTPDDMVRLQRTAGNAGATSLAQERSPVYDVIESAGEPLDTPVRADMERRLGHDFGDVRVHTDERAHESARDVGATAYTVGSHVVFQRSQYEPGTDAGRLTLAHELTHVVQQRRGPVDGTAMPGGISVSDPSDRFEREAEQNAERALVASVDAAAPVQRQEDEEIADEDMPT